MESIIETTPSTGKFLESMYRKHNIEIGMGRNLK